MEFKVGNKVYLKLSPIKGMVRFGNKGNLISRYVSLYEIFQRICKVAYELKFPNEFASVHRFSMFPSL